MDDEQERWRTDWNLGNEYDVGKFVIQELEINDENLGA